MTELSNETPIKVEPEQLSKPAVVFEVFHGIGLVLGMGLLWSLELVRNAWFRLLDRWNVKARPRTKVSAFPPGKPRRHSVHAN